MNGPHSRLRRRSTAALVLASATVLVVTAALLLDPSDGSGPTAQRNGTLSPASTANPSASASHGATPTPGQSHAATPAASASRTPAGTAAPTRLPVSNAAPPAAGYFALRGLGSWSSLPSDAQCAAQVHYSTWEPRTENAQQNNTKPAPGAMAAAFKSRPRAVGGTYNPLWDSWLLRRVDGQFTGRTDEIFQWAACKWGLPDNVIRSVANEESTWFEYLHFQNDASYGGGGGSCYWQYGCGDAFSSASAASTVYCKAIATQGLLPSEVHDYQKDPVTGAGGYPWTPGPGLCPKTFSILGVMSWEDPAWQAPYPAYAGNQNGTFPFTRDSTAAAADYYGAYIRGCYEGWITWLKGSGYAAGDLWGCVGLWYSGDWHSSAANRYTANVQNNLNIHIWLTPDFIKSRQQYRCDARYGCPV